MRTAVALMLLVMVALTSPLLAQLETPPPLPENLKIEPPGPAVPPRLAVFSGVWEGVWRSWVLHPASNRPYGGTSLIIAIEKIEPPQATVVYAWGSSLGSKEGWIRIKGTIFGESILLEFGRESKRQVTLKPTGNSRLIEADQINLKSNFTFSATLRKR